MPKNKVLCLRDKVKKEIKKQIKCKFCDKTFYKVNLYYKFMRIRSHLSAKFMKKLFTR